MRKISCLLALAGVLYMSAAWPADDPDADWPDAESAAADPDTDWADAEAAAPGRETAFYSRFYLLAYGNWQDVKESPANPGNILGLTSREAVINPRVDLELTLGRWEFSVKPRAHRTWEKWDQGPRDGERRIESDLFVNEGFVRFRPIDQLLLSVGRENLQWGPSAIMSSSNPFNRANGRNNPRLELPGLDFARAVWIPNSTWTLSTIANTGAGRMETRDPFAALLPATPGSRSDDDFRRSYALKLDYTGENGYFSLIPSRREDSRYRLGFFGGWTVSDALLVYGEGSIGQRKRDEGGLVPGSPAREGERIAQVGAAYTLEAGPTLTLELLYNKRGCKDDPIAVCVASGKVDGRDVLLRRRYAMLQLTDTDSLPDLNVTVRLLRNLDDQSQHLVGIFEYDLSDHVQLYLNLNRYFGNTSTELGSLLRHSVFAGVGYTF